MNAIHASPQQARKAANSHNNNNRFGISKYKLPQCDLGMPHPLLVILKNGHQTKSLSLVGTFKCVGYVCTNYLNLETQFAYLGPFIYIRLIKRRWGIYNVIFRIISF